MLKWVRWASCVVLSCGAASRNFFKKGMGKEKILDPAEKL